MPEHFEYKISEHWRQYLADKVDNREYGSPGEVIEDALRRLEDEDRRRERLAELLREGEESGDPIPWDFEAFLEEARLRDGRREAA